MKHKFASIVLGAVLPALFTANAYANRAFCFPDGTCAMVESKSDVAAQCTDLDGVIQERGITCADNPCGIPCEDTEVTCDDGFDNDCDGLVDEEDPDCSGAGCPEGYPDRMPSQVVTDLFAAIAAGNEVLAACNYYGDATAINDQGICSGAGDIIGAHFNSFDGFGVGITVNELVSRGNYVRLLYTVEGNGIAIEDGVFAFHVEGGRIRNHIGHGPIGLAGGG